MILEFKNNQELVVSKEELVFNSNNSITNLKTYREASLWFEASRLLGNTSVTVDDYYNDFVKFDERLKTNEILYQKTEVQRPNKKNSIG